MTRAHFPSLAFVLFASVALPAQAVNPECNATPDRTRVQYIVGYGSVMQAGARASATPSAGPAHPVEVKGFRRGWYSRSEPGAGGTYLSAVADRQSRMNAVLYQVDVSDLASVDKRESAYCRIRISFRDVTFLEPHATPPGPAQGWLYVAMPEAASATAGKLPIAKAEVAAFLSGCLEQEQRFGLPGFAQECIASTAGW
jgi:hypothetical protein